MLSPRTARSRQTAAPVIRFIRLRAAGEEVSKAASMAVCRESMETREAAKLICLTARRAGDRRR